MLKRFLSLMLALSMVLSLACVSAFAAEDADAAQSDSAGVVAEAVEEPDAQPEETANDTDDPALELMEDPKVWVEEPTVELGVKKSHSLWIYSNLKYPSGRDKFSFKVGDKSIATAEWTLGGGLGTNESMRIKGVKEGTTTITVSAKKDGVVLASTTITVIVKGSGSTNPEPNPDPEPDPEPSKTPVIESSESSVQLKSNEDHSVLISTNLAANEFDHINASSKNGLVSAVMGQQANNTSYYLNLKGLKAGTDMITVTLEGTKTNGEKVLATVKINVTVTAAPDPDPEPFRIWTSESSVTLKPNETRTIVVNRSSYAKTMGSANTDSSCATLEWGDWADSSHNSVYLTIKGLKAGSAVITVFARDENGNELGSADINVTVTGSSSGSDSAKIWSSESSVKLAANSTHKVVVSKNSSSEQMGWTSSDTACVTAEWGDWVDSSHSSKYLTIKGLKAGSAVITLYAGDGNNKVLATSQFNVTVTAASRSDTKKPGKTGLKVKKATKKLISLSWNKVSKASGYEVSLNIKGNPKTFRVKTTSYQINLTGGKSKMAYTVKVRAYKTVNGKTIYGKWTTKKGKLK